MNVFVRARKPNMAAIVVPPSGLSRHARALAVISELSMRRIIDRDATKILKVCTMVSLSLLAHYRVCVNFADRAVSFAASYNLQRNILKYMQRLAAAKNGVEEDYVISAVDAYCSQLDQFAAADGGREEEHASALVQLVDSLELVVTEALSSGDADVGTPMVSTPRHVRAAREEAGSLAGGPVPQRPELAEWSRASTSSTSPTHFNEASHEATSTHTSSSSSGGSGSSAAPSLVRFADPLEHSTGSLPSFDGLTGGAGHGGSGGGAGGLSVRVPGPATSPSSASAAAAAAAAAAIALPAPDLTPRRCESDATIESLLDAAVPADVRSMAAATAASGSIRPSPPLPPASMSAAAVPQMAPRLTRTATGSSAASVDDNGSVTGGAGAGGSTTGGGPGGPTAGGGGGGGGGSISRVTGHYARARAQSVGLGMTSQALLGAHPHHTGGYGVVPVTVVYFAEEMRGVAEELAAGPARDLIVLHEIKWGAFPDSFPDLFIKGVKDIRFNSVLFLASFSSCAQIFHQLSVIYSLPHYGAKRFTTIIPWFAPGTMERVDEIGQVATAATLAKMLSATPFAANGPSQFVILDIHALSEHFYFGDSVQVRLKSCLPLLRDRLLRLRDVDNIRIAFPDEGAAKRFKSKLGAFGEPVVCVKWRDGDARRIRVAEGDPAGKHCVLVDDLVQSGGTLLQAAKALKEAGATRVSAYCTHAVFPNESWRKFLPPPASPAAATTAADVTSSSSGSGGGYGPRGSPQGPRGASSSRSSTGFSYDEEEEPDHGGPVYKFWICNTIPGVASRLRGVAPFEVLSMAPILEDILGV